MEYRYSFTRLATHEDCPRKYKYEFVAKGGSKAPDSIHAVVGSLVHASIAMFHRAVAKPTPAHAALILEIYDSLEARLDPSSYQIPIDRPARYFFKRGRALVHGYATQWPPLFTETVIAVEQPLKIAVNTDAGMVEIDGIADKISTNEQGEIFVTDFKTTPAPPPHNEASDFHQAAIYWLGLREAGEKRNGYLRYHYLDSQLCMVRKADNDAAESALDWIRKTVEQIKADGEDNKWEARANARCRTCRFAAVCPEGSSWLGGSLTRDKLF